MAGATVTGVNVGSPSQDYIMTNVHVFPIPYDSLNPACDTYRFNL